MIAHVKDFTLLRAALIFGRLAVVFGMDTHIHTHAHTQGEGAEVEAGAVCLLLMVLVVVAIWIHRGAAAGCSYAHAGACLRDGPDDIRVAP